MKKILLLVIFFCSVSFIHTESVFAKVADTKHIDLVGQTQDERLRSIFPVQAWLDGADVYVSFLDSPVKATVTITDAEGLLVEEVVAFSPQTIQVPISKEGGSYKIEIVYGDVCLYGQFECGE